MDWGRKKGASLLWVPTLRTRTPTPTPQIAHRLSEGEGAEDALWRAHCVIQHRGQRLRSKLPFPTALVAYVATVGPVGPHHERLEIGGLHGRDRPRYSGGASVCREQQRSRVVPESAELLGASAAHGPTDPCNLCPKPPP